MYLTPIILFDSKKLSKAKGLTIFGEWKSTLVTTKQILISYRSNITLVWLWQVSHFEPNLMNKIIGQLVEVDRRDPSGCCD